MRSIWPVIGGVLLLALVSTGVKPPASKGDSSITRTICKLVDARKSLVTTSGVAKSLYKNKADNWELLVTSDGCDLIVEGSLPQFQGVRRAIDEQGTVEVRAMVTRGRVPARDLVSVKATTGRRVQIWGRDDYEKGMCYGKYNSWDAPTVMKVKEGVELPKDGLWHYGYLENNEVISVSTQ